MAALPGQRRIYCNDTPYDFHCVQMCIGKVKYTHGTKKKHMLILKVVMNKAFDEP
jgi:hypothetical protein